MQVSKIAIPGLASVASGLIGWLLHAGTIDGTTLGTTLGLSSATLVAGIALLTQIKQAWTAAGGKIDGKLTVAEFDAIADTITDKLAPQLRPLVDAVAPTVVPLANQLLAGVSPQATQLIDQLSAWFGDEKPDPNESVLNAKLLDILAAAVKDDPEGSAAAAKLRARLHESLFPTLPTAAAIKVS